MSDTLDLDHERVDDLPLILGLASRRNLPDILDPHLGRHHLHQGLSLGWIATVWIAYVLSHGDSRKSAVHDWARTHRVILERLIGQPLRDAEFTHDRLAILLGRLAPTEVRSRVEAPLWAATCEVYQLPVEQVRLDSTTSYGFHAVADGGLVPTFGGAG
jgi:transposase